MAPDERSRVEASQALTEQLGPAAAAALMECIPPYGWHEIATKSDLRAIERRLDGLERSIERRLDGLERGLDGLEGSLDGLEGSLDGLEGSLGLRFDARLHAEMNRMIRWTVASLFGGLAALSGAAAALAALLG